MAPTHRPSVAITTAALLLVAACCLGMAKADCPDRDVRCRIPNAETQLQISENGCSAAANAGVEVSGAGPVGSVGINGECYNTYREESGTTFVPTGVIKIGTCYQYQFGDMSVDQSCRPCGGATLGQKCNEAVSGCRKCDSVCTRTHTVQGGDNCWAIADSNGIALGHLQALNPGVNCDPLEIGTVMCLEMGQGQCTDMCEGRYP